MDVTKILLIQCYGFMQPHNAEPLAIETLAGALRDKFSKRVTVDIQLLAEHDDSDGSALLKQIAKNTYDIIGLSVPQGTYYLALNFLNNLKREKISALIVLGHSLPTNIPGTFLKSFPDALIVRGWGDDAIIRIIEQYNTGKPNWHEVPNLAFMEQGAMVNTLIEWPNSPSSTVRINPENFFPRVEASRGCHYNVCTFCTRPPGRAKTGSWMRYPPHVVEREIRKLKQRGIVRFTFADEDFFGDNLDSAEIIAKRIKELGGMKFSLDLRVDNIWNREEPLALAWKRQEILRLLRDGGLSMIFMGVESLSNSQLKRYGKGIQVTDAIEATKIVQGLGIHMELGYMLFDPLMTMPELQENVLQLEKSMLWKFIGQIFNRLRAQSGSAYVNMLTNFGLLGDFNPNTMEYSYKFQDPTIMRVAEICLEWKDRVDEVYSLARNVQRITFVGDNPCVFFVHEYRKLQLDILKSLVDDNVESTTELDSSYISRRTNLVTQLHCDLLRSSNTLSPIEYTLIAAIDRFITQQDA